MKKFYLIFIILCGLFLSVNFSYALTYVDGYYRSDGTYVNPYYRHSADDIRIPGDNIRTIIIIKPAEKSELEKIQERKNELDKELQDAIKAQEDRAFQLRQNEYYFSIPCVFPIMPSASGCFREEHYDREYALAKRSGFPLLHNLSLDRCRKSIDDYNQAMDDYDKNKQAYDQCFDNYIEQRINEIAEKKIKAEKQIRQDNLSKLNDLCFNNYGFSFWDITTQSCKCDDLRWMVSGKCQLGLLFCINLLGPNVIASTTGELTCSCVEGYELKEKEKDKFSCEKIEAKITNSSNDDEKKYEELKDQYNQKYGKIEKEIPSPNVKLSPFPENENEGIKTEEQKQMSLDTNQDDGKADTESKKPVNQSVSFFRKVVNSVSGFIMKFFWFRK